MNPLALTAVQTAAVLALAPLMVGLVRTFKARLQGRHGASPFLPYLAILTIFRKEEIVPTCASWVFRAGPLVVLASMVFLAAFLPTVAVGGAGSVAFGGMFVVMGTFVVGAVFLALGAMDAGSAFGGMGASREMALLTLVEPVFAVSLAGLAVVRGSVSLGDMIGVGSASPAAAPFLVLPLAALALVALAENARYPVDNPATHLELTMVHEAMTLNHSGPSLAMLEYASAIKLTLLALFIADVILPVGVLTASSSAASVAVAAGLTLAKLVAVAAALALLESSIAKMRLYRMQEFLSGALLLALVGLVMAIVRASV